MGGYLISGDEQFIANIDNFKETFDRLIALTKDNPFQAERAAYFINKSTAWPIKSNNSIKNE
ncbi:CHASE3 domain-containing protein [Legionella bozemanae]|uniref:Regulatory protein (GGDEF domain) n=1 Tax=Legionella bozemanae TaxID=447 RepID=A0A0W0RQG7_LEGBO|nr:CHASE3 domain-containing protein [Legionella bozemanae]KTC73323.1 regulatory protein (GGDEF domain) [Legionella bozemanae]STO35658.1 Uncharacterised protein [Legionella bozemanae]